MEKLGKSFLKLTLATFLCSIALLSDGTNMSAHANYYMSLRIKGAGEVQGSVQNPSGTSAQIDCSTSGSNLCSAWVEEGAIVRLLAIPNNAAGFVNDGWQSEPCTLNKYNQYCIFQVRGDYVNRGKNKITMEYRTYFVNWTGTYVGSFTGKDSEGEVAGPVKFAIKPSPKAAQMWQVSVSLPGRYVKELGGLEFILIDSASLYLGGFLAPFRPLDGGCDANGGFSYTRGDSEYSASGRWVCPEAFGTWEATKPRK